MDTVRYTDRYYVNHKVEVIKWQIFCISVKLVDANRPSNTTNSNTRYTVVLRRIWVRHSEGLSFRTYTIPNGRDGNGNGKWESHHRQSQFRRPLTGLPRSRGDVTRHAHGHGHHATGQRSFQVASRSLQPFLPQFIRVTSSTQILHLLTQFCAPPIG